MSSIVRITSICPLPKMLPDHALAAIRDPQLVVLAVTGALGVKEAGEQPLLQSLENYLGEKRMLLLLDNFEQVLEAAPMVTELLSAAPDLKVLSGEETLH